MQIPCLNLIALPPPVVIERVLLDGAELNMRQPIEIPPGKSNLEIHYTGLSLGKPEQVQFSTQLSGLTEEWVDVGRRRTAYFSQLQPGHYRFSVRALSPDGVWSAEAASLPLVVKPHFWKTLWFRSFALAALAGLLVLGYRQRVAVHQRRVAQQEEFARELLNAQERERQRIVADLHDGLGQSLVVIKRRAQQGLTKAEDTELVLEQMQEIADATNTALDEVRDVIFNLRPPQLERLGLIGAISALLDRAAESNGWRIKKQFDEIDGIFPPEAENSLYRIVQECLTNISKHAAATEVTVQMMRRMEAVELTVHDNGRGVLLDKSAPTGFGWRGLRERAHLLSGRLTITSTPGQGTTIRLVLLLPILTADK